MSARQAKRHRKAAIIRLTTLREVAARICTACAAGYPLDQRTGMHDWPVVDGFMRIGCPAAVVRRMIADEELAQWS